MKKTSFRKVAYSITFQLKSQCQFFKELPSFEIHKYTPGEAQSEQNDEDYELMMIQIKNMDTMIWIIRNKTWNHLKRFSAVDIKVSQERLA